MNTIVRRGFEPLNLSQIMNHIFADPAFTDMASVEEGNLALDVSEDAGSVIVRASLPGFRKEDIDVQVHDGVMAINAKRSEETESKDEKFYRKERRMTSVSRRIALPAAVAEDQTRAELKDGVLTLRMPKSARSMAKKIAIS